MAVMHRRLLLVAMPCLAAPALRAQEAFPGGRTLTLVVGWVAGGLADTVMRRIAEFARAQRGVQAVVDNRPGAGSALALERVARATPDGLTVTLTTATALHIIPQLQPTGYDPLALTPLGQVSVHPLPVYVRADSPLRDWAGLLAYARAHPGRLSWGTTGTRSFAEVVVGDALRREGVETTTVPFRGGAEAITAMLGGHLDAIASTDFGPLLARGEVRLLAETGPNKVPGYPEVPTFAELGYPLSAPVAYGFVAAPGLPAAAVAWWDALLRDVCADAGFASLIERLYGQVQQRSAAEYGRGLRTDHALFAAALRS